MTTKYQRYLERKREKGEKKKTKTRLGANMPRDVERAWARTSPIHECLVPDTLYEKGMGNLAFSRLMPDGRIANYRSLSKVFQAPSIILLESPWSAISRNWRLRLSEVRKANHLTERIAPKSVIALQPAPLLGISDWPESVTTELTDSAALGFSTRKVETKMGSTIGGFGVGYQFRWSGERFAKHKALLRNHSYFVRLRVLLNL
jgi:hypothetical protein